MKLKKYFEKTNTTQADLSRATGIGKALICKYTQGERMPNLANAKRIVKATNGKVTWEDLILEKD